MSFAGRRQCSCPRWSYGFDPSPLREWVVVQRNENRSAFNRPDWRSGSYEKKESRWSHVLCLTCGAHWRTQANYTNYLPDVSEEGKRLCYQWLRQGEKAPIALLIELKPGLGSRRRPTRSRASSAAGRKR